MLQATDLVAFHVEEQALTSHEREKRMELGAWRDTNQKVVSNQFFCLVAPTSIKGDKQNVFLLQSTTGSYCWIDPITNQLRLTDRFANATLLELDSYSETQVQIKDARGWVLKLADDQKSLEFGEPELIKGLAPELVLNLQVQRPKKEAEAIMMDAPVVPTKDSNAPINGSGLPVEPAPPGIKAFFLVVLGLPIFLALAFFVSTLDWSPRNRRAAQQQPAPEQQTPQPPAQEQQQQQQQQAKQAGGATRRNVLEHENEHGFL